MLKPPVQQADQGAAAVNSAGRVPVYIVTGYLGSGKTTLIADLLGDPAMAGTAVIVNELAEAGIDQTVLADAQGGDVVLLSNGCLCCGRGTDLANAIRQLLSRARSGDTEIARILIETSGAADPGPIARQVCFDPQLRASLRYGGVLCLFDSLFGEGLLERDPVGYRQLALADTVLLTKTDLSDATAAGQAAAKVRALNATAEVSLDRAVARAFLSAGESLAERASSMRWFSSAMATPPWAHEATVGTWTIRLAGALDWPRAELAMRAIYDRYGEAILRTKGVIRTSDDPRPLVIHGINRHFHRPVRLKRWDGDPETRLVLIGMADTEKAALEIEAVLRRCRVAEEPTDRRDETRTFA